MLGADDWQPIFTVVVAAALLGQSALQAFWGFLVGVTERSEPASGALETDGSQAWETIAGLRSEARWWKWAAQVLLAVWLATLITWLRRRDVRTLSLKFGADGTRRRAFRESLEEMGEAPFDDWPLEGPRTCQWVVREISRLAEGPRAQHSLWVRGSKIPDGDRAAYEDLVLAQILETAVTYDALSVVNLACMELLVRRRQLLAEAHLGNPSAPSYDGGEYFLGAGRTAPGAVIAPALTNHVAEKMRADASIQKERRKLAETRTLQPPRKPAKGAGRGVGGGPE